MDKWGWIFSWLLFLMFHDYMGISSVFQSVVSSPSICPDCTSWLNQFFYSFLEYFTGCIRYMFEPNSPHPMFSVFHSNEDKLLPLCASSTFPFMLSSNKCF